MARKRKSGRRRRNPSRSSRRHRRTSRRSFGARRHSNPARRAPSHRRRRRHKNPSLKGALMNGGKAILIATGATVVGLGGMWALSKITTTTTAGAVAKFAITGVVAGGLVGMISPMAGALIAVMFLNVAGGAVMQALQAPKTQPTTNGLGAGTSASMMGGIQRMQPQLNAVFADNLSAVFADNLGRLGMSAHARNIIEDGRSRGLSDAQIASIVQVAANNRSLAA